MRQKYLAYFFAATVVSIWAGFVLMSRFAVKSPLNGNDIVALRFGIASTLLLPFWWFKWRVPLFNLRMLSLALCGGVGYASTAYWSFHFAPAAHGAVLLSGMLPFFMMLCSWLFLYQLPSHKMVIALVIIAIGVFSIGMHSVNNLAETWPGDLLMLLGSLLWAVYTVLVKKWNYAPMPTTIGVAILSALIFLPLYILLLPKGLTITPLNIILWQGFYHGIIVAILAMILYMQALARLGPLTLGAAMACVPTLAGLGGVLFLHEHLSSWLISGLIFTSIGAWLGSR
jgi:drug/metabolite transporter (DMT)-like permease